MSEILVIVAIALGIIMLPRLTGRRTENTGRQTSGVSSINGWMRLAIMASVLWPAIMAFFLKPWNDHWPMFFYVAIGPVALSWGIFWVLSGFRKNRTNR